MVREGGKRGIGRDIGRGREYKDSGFVTRLPKLVKKTVSKAIDHTSPTARNFPSGLNDTQVAAFMRSRALHVLLPGESLQSFPGDARGDAPIPASRNEAAVRLRLSF